MHVSWTPDRKVHGANMGPNWGRQDPGGPHVGPVNLAIWDYYHKAVYVSSFLQVSLSLDTFRYNAVEYHYNTVEPKSLLTESFYSKAVTIHPWD